MNGLTAVFRPLRFQFHTTLSQDECVERLRLPVNTEPRFHAQIRYDVDGTVHFRIEQTIERVARLHVEGRLLARESGAVVSGAVRADATARVLVAVALNIGVVLWGLALTTVLHVRDGWPLLGMVVFSGVLLLVPVRVVRGQRVLIASLRRTLRR